MGAHSPAYTCLCLTQHHLPPRRPHTTSLTPAMTPTTPPFPCLSPTPTTTSPPLPTHSHYPLALFLCPVASTLPTIHALPWPALPAPALLYTSMQWSIGVGWNNSIRAAMGQAGQTEPGMANRLRRTAHTRHRSHPARTPPYTLRAFATRYAHTPPHRTHARTL